MTITLAKWSVADYHQMIASGILQGRQVELLQGSIVEMAPEKPIHYNTEKRDSRYLEKLLAGKADVRFNGPITFSDSEPEPDIAIVRLPESMYDDRHPYPEDIYWLVEVANSSLSTDLTIKAKLYATANIAEYWVLDLKNRQIVVFRSPDDGRYTSEDRFDSGAITPLSFPGIQVSLLQKCSPNIF